MTNPLIVRSNSTGSTSQVSQAKLGTLAPLPEELIAKITSFLDSENIFDLFKTHRILDGLKPIVALEFLHHSIIPRLKVLSQIFPKIPFPHPGLARLSHVTTPQGLINPENRMIRITLSKWILDGPRAIGNLLNNIDIDVEDCIQKDLKDQNYSIVKETIRNISTSLFNARCQVTRHLAELVLFEFNNLIENGDLDSAERVAEILTDESDRSASYYTLSGAYMNLIVQLFAAHDPERENWTYQTLSPADRTEIERVLIQMERIHTNIANAGDRFSALRNIIEGYLTLRNPTEAERIADTVSETWTGPAYITWWPTLALHPIIKYHLHNNNPDEAKRVASKMDVEERAKFFPGL